MSEIKNVSVHLDLEGNELINAAFEKGTTAPLSPFEGQHFYNTSEHKEYVYNGTSWVEETSQGDYTFQNGVKESGRAVELDIATGANAGNVTFTANANGLKGEVGGASTSAAGVIEIATDAEAATGTAETLAVNPKQLKTKVDANAAITAGTGTVVSYDAKGLVTGSSELAIKSGSANYLEYDSTNHEFGAKVDTTVGTVSTNLVTSGAVKTYVDDKISSTYKAAGSKAFAQLPALSSSIEGNVYNVSDAFTTTADFVEGAGNVYPAGTNIVCINTAAAGDTPVYKWDVLAGFVDVSSFITASSTDTLTNKSIDADDNTITDLTTTNFKAGTIVAASGSAAGSDSAIFSQKATNEAIATATAGMLTCSSLDNPSLTTSSGVCSWTVALTSGQKVYDVKVYNKTSGKEVIAGVAVTNGTSVVISFNSASNIAADTYTARLIGEL